MIIFFYKMCEKADKMISGRSGGGRNTGNQVKKFGSSRLAHKIFKSALAMVFLSFLSFIDFGCKKRQAKKDFSVEPKILIKDFVPSPHIISPKNKDGKLMNTKSDFPFLLIQIGLKIRQVYMFQDLLYIKMHKGTR